MNDYERWGPWFGNPISRRRWWLKFRGATGDIVIGFALGVAAVIAVQIVVRALFRA